MNVLFIGGTGNISSEVADQLLKQGHSITVANTGKHPVPLLYKHIILDSTDPQSCKSNLENETPDIVIDFFAFVPDHLKTMYEIFKGKIKQFIFISSATVYEKPHKQLPITESTPLCNPYWPYAQNKIACEEYLNSIHSSDFPITIVRPSHTFGRTWIPSALFGQDFTISSRILQGKPIIVHDRGESLWTLTAASDFAIGLCGLVGNSAAIGESFHITSDEALTWNKIYEILGQTLGRDPVITYIPTDFLNKIYPDSIGPLKGDKADHGVFDNSKIKSIVPGFQCKKTFKNAIRESIEWFQQDTARMQIDEKQDKFIDLLISQWNNRK